MLCAGVDDDDGGDALEDTVDVERNEAVLIAAVLIQEDDDAGCRLTHVRVQYRPANKKLLFGVSIRF